MEGMAAGLKEAEEQRRGAVEAALVDTASILRPCGTFGPKVAFRVCTTPEHAGVGIGEEGRGLGMIGRGADDVRGGAW